jgi:hypothetical protein
MKVNRKTVVTAAFALILTFLFLVPAVSYPIQSSSCPANGCDFVIDGSMTYWAFGVGGTLRGAAGYSLSVAAVTSAASSTSYASYTVTAEPTHTTTAVTDSTNNLQLQLSMNASSSSTIGVTVSGTVDEYNTLASQNNLTATNEWLVALNGGNGAPCWMENDPVGLAIASGHYSASNVTSAKFLDLVNPTATYACPAGLSGIHSYLFQPLNDTAAIYGSCSPNPCFTEMVSSGITVTGYWNQGGTFSNFPKGVYTVVAADEWGNSALTYFTVS